MQVTGIVENIVARNTRVGDMYDLVVNGKKYGAGRYAPRDIKQGDFVSFEVDVKQNGQYTNYDIRRGTIRKEEGRPPQEADKSEAKQSAKQTHVPFDNRQEVISKQAALNTALTFCNLAASLGAVPMPKTVKEADKLGLISKWVLDTAAQFYGLSTGGKWEVPDLAPAAPQKPAAAGRKAKASDEDAPPFATEEDEGYDEYPNE